MIDAFPVARHGGAGRAAVRGWWVPVDAAAGRTIVLIGASADRRLTVVDSPRAPMSFRLGSPGPGPGQATAGQGRSGQGNRGDFPGRSAAKCHASCNW
ncbi:hypothetical protein FRAAL2844 [Frankia alni ACN14a]|uniref:Uncharacterized protein n=1 Tax=Frankia alni (strain DSM 45986 / CECT 9034 / ACN14a) TaxID=326424 RepID=Q0RLW5_FRAAA|nr:hypothetical protein FRAAL2844 [Frankia alni ACN14a]